jgi:hypothetical protein
MLVKCPKCRIEFSPSGGVCPVCREYKPTKLETKEFEVAEALDSSASPDAVRQRLLDAGCDEFEVGKVLRDIQSKARNENRVVGVQRIVLGALLVGGYYVTWVLMLGNIIFPMFLIIGVLLILVGMFQFAFGNRIT